MSFMNDIADVTQSIKDLDALQESAQRAGEFESRSNELAPLSTAYMPLDTIVKVLSSLQPSFDLGPHDELLPLLSRLDELKTRYGNNANAIINPFPDDPEYHYRHQFLLPIGALYDQLLNELKSGWTSWCNDQLHLPEGMANILEVFGGLAQLRQQVLLIRDKVGIAEGIVSRLPTSLEVVDELRSLGIEINNLWSSLVGNGVPDSVMQFLLSAGAGNGTSYNDLTEDVLHWLKDHELLSSVRIKIG